MLETREEIRSMKPETIEEIVSHLTPGKDVTIRFSSTAEVGDLVNLMNVRQLGGIVMTHGQENLALMLLSNPNWDSGHKVVKFQTTDQFDLEWSCARIQPRIDFIWF